MVTIELIIETACKTLEINKDELLSDSMKKPLPDARKIIASLCRDHCVIKRPTKRRRTAIRNPTYLEIATELKRKKAETIMYCVLECKQLLKIDSVFRERYNSVLEALNWHLGNGISQFEKPENQKR